jgi:hypothetical protein
MKEIARIFYTEPVITLLTANAVIASLAASGKVSEWISVAFLAGTAVLLRGLVTPAKK